MARPKATVPGYCHHRQSGRAYVTLGGRQKLLPGAFESTESRAAYDRLVAEYLNAGRTLPTPTPDGPTVATVALGFWKHAAAFYVDAAGAPTGEATNYRPAIAALRRLYGATPAKRFGPKALKALRRAMTQPAETTDPATGEKTTRPGWSRRYANRQADRVKYIFRWAASEEMVPAAVADALAQVDAIRAGQDGVRETDKVLPVDETTVEATLPHLPPPVAALVKLQLLTGARGRELFRLRTGDIDRTGAVWKYTPAGHKTAHHGHGRTIYFGPRAQEILTPFLSLDPQAYLFRPADAVAWRNERQRAKRKTPMTPSQRRRAELAAKRQRKYRPHYTKDTYTQAIARGCVAAGAAHWHPHQLRHAAGTRYRREGDFEAAKIVLGHRTDSMTQHYAERDERKAKEVVTRIG
jgi:integrase